MKQPVLIRGGISRREFYRKQSIAYGPALVSAYNTENLTKYPRIMIHEDIISEYKMDSDKESFIYMDDNNYYVSYWFSFYKDKKYRIINNIKLLLKETIDKTEEKEKVKELKSVLQKYEYIVDKLNRKN